MPNHTYQKPQVGGQHNSGLANPPEGHKSGYKNPNFTFDHDVPIELLDYASHHLEKINMKKKVPQFSLGSQASLWPKRQVGSSVTGRIINFEDYIVDMPLMHKLDADA